MRGRFTIRPVLSLTIISLFLFRSQAAGAPPVTLTIQPFSAQYDTHTEHIDLQVTLQLAASATGPVTVCTFAGATLRFAGVTANGVRVKPQRAAFLPEEPRSLFHGRCLVTLQPGGSVNLPLRLIRRGDNSVQVRNFRPSKRPGPDSMFTYRLPVPGTYSFALTYHYWGPDGGHSDIFRQSVTSNTFTMVLVH